MTKEHRGSWWFTEEHVKNRGGALTDAQKKGMAHRSNAYSIQTRNASGGNMQRDTACISVGGGLATSVGRLAKFLFSQREGSRKDRLFL
jgi:hypothetical protein